MTPEVNNPLDVVSYNVVSYTELQEQNYHIVDKVVGDLQNSPDYSAYLVPGTGFYVREQVYAFANAAAHIQSENQSSQHDEETLNKINKIWKKDALGKTIQDIRSFYQEFIEYRLALPIPTAIRQWNGAPRLFARYGESWVLYEDIVDEEEREGAALSAIRNAERALVENLDNNTKVIMVSPMGWTGLADPPRHDISQIYIYGQDESLTLRVGMSHKEVESFLNSFAGKQVSIEGLSEKQRIKEIMNVAVAVPNCEFLDIAQKVGQVMQSEIVLEDDLGERKLSEMFSAINNREKTTVLGSRVEYLIEKLEEYVNSLNMNDFSESVVANLAVKIGQIVLEIELADGKYKDNLHDNLKVASASLPATDNYKLAAVRLTQRTGCSHGVSKKKSKAETKILCCNCPFCGAFVEAVIKNGLIHCPSCGRSRAWKN